MLKLFYKVLPLLVAAVVPLRSTIRTVPSSLSNIINHQKWETCLFTCTHTHILEYERRNVIFGVPTSPSPCEGR